MTVGPEVSAAAMSAFSVPITDGSSIRKSQFFRPAAGASSSMSRLCLTVAPRARNASRCGIEPAAADDVATGRRHVGAAEPREQRSREQERRPDPLGEAAIDLLAHDVSGVDRHLAVADPAHAGAERLQQQDHRLDVADPRHVAQDHLVLGEQARGENRQRTILVSGGNDGA